MVICPKCRARMKVMETRTLNKTTFRKYKCECGGVLYSEETIPADQGQTCLVLSRLAGQRRYESTKLKEAKEKNEC